MNGILAVGSSALLGCVFWMLIVCLIIEMIILGVLCKFICEDYQRYRQRKQNRSETSNNQSKPEDASAINLGIFGKPNIERSPGEMKPMIVLSAANEVNKSLNLSWRRSQKKLFRLFGLIQFGGKLRRLFRCDVAHKQPNEKS